MFSLYHHAFECSWAKCYNEIKTCTGGKKGLALDELPPN